MFGVRCSEFSLLYRRNLCDRVRVMAALCAAAERARAPRRRAEAFA